MARIRCRCLVKTLGMKEDEWLKWRRKGIGSSDIAAALGMSKYCGRVELWLEKQGLSEKTFSEETLFLMRLGKLMEPVIRQIFVEHNPGHRVELKHSILQHNKHDWALANLDGIVRKPDGEIQVLEMKNIQELSFASWRGEIPTHYMLQMQHQLFVTGLKRAMFAVLVGHKSYKQWTVERNEDTIAMIEKEGAAFWEAVTLGYRPCPSAADTESIGKLYPRPENDYSINLDRAVVDGYKLAHDNAERAEEALELWKNTIKQLIAEGSSAQCDGVKCFTWNASKDRQSFDAKALQAAMPDVYERFVKTHQGSRTFRFIGG